jgi:7-cyano-7-deazaguanine synthase
MTGDRTGEGTGTGRHGAAAPAIVLLSGGLDSSTVLHLALGQPRPLTALSFDYGQRHRGELDAARRVAARAGVAEHRVVSIDLGAFGGSALTDPALAVPRDRSEADIGRGIPITYVPARNTVFLAFALALGEVRGARELHIGVNHLDSSGYPDCRPEFLAAFERAANLGTRAGAEGRPFRVVAPLAGLTKGEIVRLGLAHGVDYGLTRSCYAPHPADLACGRCDACRLRLRGFVEAGAADPAPYAPGVERPDLAALRGLA